VNEDLAKAGAVLFGGLAALLILAAIASYLMGVDYL
jgi:hypothetical protein